MAVWRPFSYITITIWNDTFILLFLMHSELILTNIFFFSFMLYVFFIDTVQDKTVLLILCIDLKTVSVCTVL